ncbi:MAG: hypothetical protein PHD19_09530 [Dechloromonas sp.]|nr:hypothetical protein [Dechloromonas sp.]
MSNTLKFLTVLKECGVSTYRDISAATGIDINKLRWTAADLRAEKEIEQTEDPVTNEVAWRLTSLGAFRLAQRLEAPDGKASRKPVKRDQESPEALPAKPAAAPKAKAERPQPAPKKTRAVAKKPAAQPAKHVSTPAGGGADITGSQASESLVEGSGHADSSAEGLAIGDRAPQGEAPAVQRAGDKPAFSAAITTSGELCVVVSGEALMLPPEATRRLGEFMSATHPVWSAA